MKVWKSDSDKYFHIRDKYGMTCQCLRCLEEFGRHGGLKCPDNSGGKMLIAEDFEDVKLEPNMAFKRKRYNG